MTRKIEGDVLFFNTRVAVLEVVVTALEDALAVVEVLQAVFETGVTLL